jgi:3-oxochol-4-en-24-oyl-CoA dehydrogenase
VLGAPGADVLVLAAKGSDGDVWAVVEATDEGVSVEQLTPVDQTRSLGRVTVDAALPADRILAGLTTDRVRATAAAFLAAEASGIARWCFETALDYAKVREQFGRKIGSFQAIKHKAANVFTRVEVLAASAWDAARALSEEDAQRQLAAGEAAVTCLAGAREIALDCVTMLGGIGYTWEHDIALFERRAVAIGQLLGSPSEWATSLAKQLPEATRAFRLDTVDDDPDFRAKIAAGIAEAAALQEPQRRHKLAELGLVSPQYPPPFGIGANPNQQLVIQQEYAKAGIAQPSTVIGAFALPALLAHGTPEQHERFVTPSMRGEIVWCQLFSEPNAGSDLASLRTQATKVDGGWKLNGQKVWNSVADRADWGICLARSDNEAVKHAGISYFLVDMHSPGVEARPLRQTTGEAEFNEVFLTDVFVPDDCLVGNPGEGWKIATTTLANERLMIASGFGTNPELQQLRSLLSEPAVAADPAALVAVGRLVAENFALAALNLRAVLQQLQGFNPGATSSVLKLASTEHKRQLAGVVLELTGPAAAVESPEALQFLRLPSVMIGGGTREIQLNVVSERVLGLPRG